MKTNGPVLCVEDLRFAVHRRLPLSAKSGWVGERPPYRARIGNVDYGDGDNSDDDAAADDDDDDDGDDDAAADDDDDDDEDDDDDDDGDDNAVGGDDRVDDEMEAITLMITMEMLSQSSDFCVVCSDCALPLCHTLRYFCLMASLVNSSALWRTDLCQNNICLIRAPLGYMACTSAVSLEPYRSPQP